MRIGIDFHSAAREGSGNCTYIRNLVENLIRIDKENEYYLYILDIQYPYYNKFKNIENVKLRLLPIKNPLLRIPLLGLKTYVDKIDILHVQYVAPPFYSGKLVVMIHDIGFVHYPECFRRHEYIRQKLLIPINIKKADIVLTDSISSKADIVNIYNPEEAKVKVIYHGVTSEYTTLADLKNAKGILTGFYEIESNFILFVGRIDARKNIGSLINAFLFLKEKENISHKLVIAGKKDFLPDRLLRELKNSEYDNDIIFTGYIQDEHLPLLYNLADVFVYPSLYEGFGLPCLEAMACGCPVVASNISSIPEVIGDAGMLIDPANVQEMASAIYEIISKKELKEDLRNKGLLRATQFSWENTAKKTLEVYYSITS